ATMPLWQIDFSDINSETTIPEGVGEEDELPEGYCEEYEVIDVFVMENLLRAKESKDAAMVNFIVEQAIARYSRLGLKQAVLDKEIWITQQIGRGILANFQAKKRGEELQTQIQYMQELIVDQKQKDQELRARVANLRAERDFKKAKLEAVLRHNQGMMSEIDHIKKRIALTQERIRLDTIEYEREKALREDLMKTFVEYTEDLDRQLKNAPWLVEKQKQTARRKELEDEVAALKADLAKIDLIEKRNQQAEVSERELPFKQFCVQLAELYMKREKMTMQLQHEKDKVRKFEEERRQRRALEDSSQLDCTQAMLDADLDDEETLMKMAKHYKLDTQSAQTPVTQMTQDSQLPPSQPPNRKRAQSPAESTASSEANDTDMSDVSGEQQTTVVVPPPAKRVSIQLPPSNPDESVDEDTAVQMMNKDTDESQTQEDEQNGDRSQPEQMETDEREEEQEEEEGREEVEVEKEVEEEEEEEQMELNASQQLGSQESEMGSVAGGQMEQGEEEEEGIENGGFIRPSDVLIKEAPPTQENEEMRENEEAETSFNPDMMLDLSASSQDPGNDFFDMMNGQATRKRAAVDAMGGSPAGGGSEAGDDGGFMNMFGGGDVGGGGGADAASFSFNFGGGDANETNGGGGAGGEFNFFGF
ncbi:hypothetical protein PFISCL1PPCAC_6722, partial [Pristionchus fissidentatus]